jgi:hypothetical protein
LPVSPRAPGRQSDPNESSFIAAVRMGSIVKLLKSP